ncbi:MAG TPA: hypothetical protein VLA29_02860 [Acidimicrobiia bacterium]|nr:hypothetical protein [Acidimicrobiia bacterium]
MTTNVRPWQRRYPRLERPWLIWLFVVGVVGVPATANGVPTTMIGLGPLAPLGIFVTLGALILLTLGAFVVVPRFARNQVSGMVGGVVTGLVLLGGGLRLAMRLVVLTDDVREPVFTSETGFIIFFGGVVGLMMGPFIAIAQRLWAPRSALIGAVVTTMLMSMFLIAPGLRTELFNEGAGPLLNIPLFTATFFAFGASANEVISRIERRLPWTPGRDLPPVHERRIAVSA